MHSPYSCPDLVFVACLLAVDSRRTVDLEKRMRGLASLWEVPMVPPSFLPFSFSTRRRLLPDSSWFMNKRQKNPMFLKTLSGPFPTITRLGRPFGKGGGDRLVSGKVDEVIDKMASQRNIPKQG